MAFKTAPDPSYTGWPKSIAFIIGNEGCERFSFYGMKAILKVFLATMYVSQGMEELRATNESNAAAHFFMMGVYAFPVLGAVFADRLLAKYNTILWLSLFYCAGHAVLAFSESYLPGFYVGLGLIAFGSGGIKPNVSAHMGDQFGRGNRDKLEKAFQAFYFIINFGSFFSTLLIPVIKENEFLKSHGLNWSVAFGVPGVLMAIATVFFWLGRNRFIVVPANPGGKLGLLDGISSTLMLLPFVFLLLPTDSIPASVKVPVALGLVAVGVVLFIVRQRMKPDDGFLAVMVYSIKALLTKSELPPLPQASEGVGSVGADKAGNLRHHWFFGAAARRFGQEAAEGPIAVMKIIGVFSFVSVFWALFDQHSTSWIDQAKMMDLHVLGFTLLPEQIQALNPVMVMILIPFVTFVLYPGVTKLGFEMRPLRRMSMGMFLTATAFVAAAIIQKQLDGGAHLAVGWQIGQYLLLTLAEVMVSVTGLEFAYTQAPRRMKSTMTSFWLLTVSVGNALAGWLFHSLSYELVDFFWLFAKLMTVAAVLFSAIAALYKYKEYTQDERRRDEPSAA